MPLAKLNGRLVAGWSLGAQGAHRFSILLGNRATLFPSILNLSDEDPPRVFPQLNYELLGRLMSVRVRLEL